MGLVGRKGKLSLAETAAGVQEVAWERYEDVLTADVFGAYRYLPPEIGINALLRHAVDETGQSFAQYLERCGISLSSLDVARFRFWPTFSNGREPDVFALLQSTLHPRSVAFLVEAKYHADQHEISGHSQLGHYLIEHLAGNYAAGSVVWELPEWPRPMLFITKHSEIPSAHLARARVEASQAAASPAPAELGLFWVNWATAGQEAQRLWKELRGDVESAPWLRLLLDVYEEVRDRDLMPRPPFRGIGSPDFPALGPLPCICRRYIRRPAVAISQASPFYCRSYRLGHLAIERAPAGYTKIGAADQ